MSSEELLTENVQDVPSTNPQQVGDILIKVKI